MKTYEVFIKCNNCLINSKEKIPRGQKAKDYLKTTNCSNCGLKQLEITDRGDGIFNEIWNQFGNLPEKLTKS